MSWNIIIPVAGLLLLMVAAVKEYTRPNRQMLGWRLLSTGLAVLALTCMGLPITYKLRVQNTEAGIINIVTNGYTGNSLIGSSVTNNIKLATGSIQYVPDLSHYLQEHPEYQSARIFGYGLPPWELERLPIRVFMEDPGLPAGIIKAHWQPYLDANQPLQVRGQYHNTGTNDMTLVLEGLHTPLDSITIPPGLHSFVLTTVPKHIQTAIYHLVTLKGRDTISSQPLPVHVQSVAPANILILASAPDFENRFLSDWLNNHQYPVVVKSSISKNKTAVQFSNTRVVSVGTLNSQLLSAFDVVIADDENIYRLSGVEQAALRNAVENGLGMIVKMMGSSGKSFAVRPFNIVQVPGNTNRNYSLQFQTSVTPQASLTADQWSFIRPQQDEQPLVTTKQDQWIAGCSLNGKGKLVATTLYNSYTWFLSGQTNHYAAYWSLLIEKAARQKKVAVHWSLLPQFPQANEPVQVTVINNSREIPVIKTTNAKLFMQQDIYLPAEWKGTWWPRQTGWQNLVSGADTLPVFVFNGQDWQAARSAAMLEEQQQRIQQAQNQDNLQPKTTHRTAIRLVPKIYFFMLFLACCSFLWIESKRISRK